MVIDFLLRHYSFVTHTVEFIAVFTGLFYFKNYKETPTKYFIYFLIFIAFADTVSGYTTLVKYNKPLSFLIGTRFEKNHWLATLAWDVGATLFYALYFYKILKNVLVRRIIKYLGIAFFLFSMGTIVLNWDLFFVEFFKSIEVVGAAIILFCCIMYFVEILQSEDILNFYKSMSFYIASTIFIWWLVITPVSFYDVYFTYQVGSQDRDWDFYKLRHQIYLVANIFMYLTFTFAFIWCQPKKD